MSAAIDRESLPRAGEICIDGWAGPTGREGGEGGGAGREGGSLNKQGPDPRDREGDDTGSKRSSVGWETQGFHNFEKKELVGRGV